MKALHRLVYPAAIGVVVHFLWLVKADLREPLVYASVIGLLLALRVFWWLRSSQARGRLAPPGETA